MSRVESQINADPYTEVACPCQDCCQRCLCCFCCCKYVHKSTRIKIVWALLILSATASSVILGCAVFRPDFPLVSPSDMRAVTEHTNFLFCEEVAVESGGLHFDTYRVTGALKIDQELRNLASFEGAVFLENNDYDYYSFYFLPQSNMTMFQCSTEQVTFYVFQGQDNFDAWKKDRSCEECYLSKQYLQESKQCSSKTEFSLNVQEEDMYFVVYENQLGNKAWVDVNLYLNRSMYDLTDALSICVDTTECTVVMEEPKQTVVYQVASYGDLDEYRHSELKTRCVPRVWSYLLFHITFVLVFGITCSILIQKFCKNPDSMRYLNTQVTETTPLLYGTSSPPAYTSVIMSPPKYDDAMRYSDPPSYSDVTSGMLGYTLNSQRGCPKHNVQNPGYSENTEVENSRT